MSFIYCGFSTEAMINFMAKHSKTSHFKMEHEGSESGVFSLVISNKKYGVFNNHGRSLTGLVSQAFKPYLDEAKEDREQFSSKFQSLIRPRTYKIQASKGIGDIKMVDDEFKCVRRIAAELGLSMPESDEDLLTYSTFRQIERALKHKESK